MTVLTSLVSHLARRQARTVVRGTRERCLFDMAPSQPLVAPRLAPRRALAAGALPGSRGW